MKKSRLITCTLFVLSFFNLAKAQSLQGAIIYFEEKDHVIYLDGKKTFSSKTILPLDTGYHRIKVWAPGRNLLIDSFYVKPNKTTFYVKHLKENANYIAFKEQKKIYYSYTYAFPAIFVATAVSFYGIDRSLQHKIDSKRNDALQFLDKSYVNSVSPADFENAKKNYDAYNADYNKLIKQQKNFRTVGGVVNGITGGLAIFGIVKAIIGKKPVFKETPLLSKISIDIYSNTKSNYLCLKYNIR